MAGERGLVGDLRGLGVAHLADHDDVRVVTQELAQRLREGVTLHHRNLHLLDAIHVVFDGVLDGEQMHVALFDLVEDGVQRGRIARTGRSRHEILTVRPRDEAADQTIFALLQAQGLQRPQTRLFIEDTDHSALALYRRHYRYAQVDRLVAPGETRVTILRQAALGDVHLRAVILMRLTSAGNSERLMVRA